MCDLFAAIGVKDGTKLRQFMKEAAPKIKGYRNKHGIGYTAITKDGKLFGERWLDPEQAFKGKPVTDSDTEVVKEYAALMDEVPDLDCYNRFGSQAWSNVRSAIYHARYATCEKSMDNVHPFNLRTDKCKGVTSLIHNGVIKNHDELENINSTCDSEGILTQYLKRKVNLDFRNISDLFQDLDGAFTVMTTSVDSDGRRFLDIFKDDGRLLYVTRVDQLGGIIFTSDKDIVIDTCKKLNWTHKNMLTKVKNNTFCRFDVVTGKLIGDVIEVEPRRSVSKANNYYNQSKQDDREKGYFRGGVWIPYNSLEDLDDYSDYEDTTPSATIEDTTNTLAEKIAATRSAAQTANRQKVAQALANKEAITNVIGIVDRNGVCSVAKFLANEEHLTNVINDGTNEEGSTTKKKDVTVSHLTGKEVTESLNTETISNTGDFLDSDFLPSLEASDSDYGEDYGAEYEEIDEIDITQLEHYSEGLNAEEQDALNELPDDIKYVYLKRSYEKKVGPLS